MHQAPMRDVHFGKHKTNINGDGIGYGNQNIVTLGDSHASNGFDA